MSFKLAGGVTVARPRVEGSLDRERLLYIYAPVGRTTPMVTFERPRPDPETEDEVLLERVLAFAIDAVGFSILVGVIANLVYLVSESLGIVLNLLGVPLFFAYFVYFEAEYGQTVGKMVTGVVVVVDGGGRIGYRAATIRALVRIVDLFPYPLHLVGLVAILLTDRNQRLGDLAADTVVLRAKEKGNKL